MLLLSLMTVSNVNDALGLCHVMQDRGSSSLLSPEDLSRIVGPGAYDQHGKGNMNVGDGGVAFLLASSGAIPGGAPLVSPSASSQR